MTTAPADAAARSAATPGVARAIVAPRLVALDIFRGLCVLGMLLVNTPGDEDAVFGQLRHASWDGWTLADTIAPGFLWIVGVALALAFGARREQGQSRGALFGRAARRAMILFGLGLLLAAIPGVVPLIELADLATLRIPGTLQRIALCYLAAAAICLWFGPRGQFLWATGLLGGYWLLMLRVPVPGVGLGSLAPGQNLANYLDALLLGQHAKAVDPFNVLGTLPAISSTLAGTLAGEFIRGKRAAPRRQLWLLLSGVVLVGLGLLITAWVPINKQLWTPSYTLLMAGLSSLLLAGLLALSDRGGRATWAVPLIALGMNAIAVFVLSEAAQSVLVYLGLIELLYRTIFAPLAAPMAASLAFALVWSLAWIGLAWLCYRRGWVFRV